MLSMTVPDAYNLKLQRLRDWRCRRERDQSLSFLPKQFKQQIEKPYRQLSQLVELWQTLVPGDLVEHTRLDSLRRGVLKVSVDSSARLYDLDRLLRQGLERQLIESLRSGGLHKVQLRINVSWREPI